MASTGSREPRLPPISSRVRFAVVPIVFCTLIFLPQVHATQVRSLTLEQMTERATTIFSGRCVAVRTLHSTAIGLPVSVVTFHVERVLQGELPRVVTLKFLGDGTFGVPRFRKGEEVVLFLYGKGRLGLTAPVGLGQGKFTISRDKLGREVAVNEMGNRNLFRGLTPAARSLLGPSLDQTESGKGFERQSLIDMIERLRP